MPEALALVKRDLGPHAVILHTRTFRRGGLLGLGARSVVEITATDSETMKRTRRRAARTKPQPVAHTGPAGDLIRKTYAAARAELDSAAPPPPAHVPVQMPAAVLPPPVSEAVITAGATAAPPLVTAPPGVPAAVSPPPLPRASMPGIDHNATAAACPDRLADEVVAVKRMVARMMRQQRQRRTRNRSKQDIPDKLFNQYLKILEQEVTEELAEEIVQQVHDVMDSKQIQDEATVRQAVLEHVARLIPTDAEQQGTAPPRRDRRPRTIALIGPTGVGKTTTIAKLAANFKLKQQQNVGLITIDTYRIAAVDQLRTYANIIGVPLHVVLSPEQLTMAIRKCAGCDVVLIDTAGRSQRDDPKLDHLNQFIEAADPDEVHLVLSSTCTQSVLLDTVQRFSKIRTDRIIFTKLDEAVTFGVLLNVARMVNKQLSFLTTGQDVPHHIEPSQPQRIAALVLGEGD